MPWIGGDLEESHLTNRVLAISNHAVMLGGGEHSFLDFISHLAFNWKVAAAVPSEGALTVMLKQRGINTHVLPLPIIRPWSVLHIIVAFRTHLSLCSKFRPALIYANGSRAAFYGGIVGKISDTPMIWHCRIAERDPCLDPVLARLSTTIIVNSQATAARFSPSSSPKIRVVYNGVDIEWIREDDVGKPDLVGEEWKIILAVARISEEKRHDILLAAFDQVAALDSTLHLVCIGSRDSGQPQWWSFLQEKSQRSSFANRIHWVGQVEDVRPWYRAAHILALASESEAFGRVLVEAMACGIPVLATHVGGIPEIVRHNQDGFLVAPGNLEELSEAMTKLMSDQDLRVRLGKSGQQQAENFSLENHLTKMHQVFRESLASRYEP